MFGNIFHKRIKPRLGACPYAPNAAGKTSLVNNTAERQTNTESKGEPFAKTFFSVNLFGKISSTQLQFNIHRGFPFFMIEPDGYARSAVQWVVLAKVLLQYQGYTYLAFFSKSHTLRF